MIIQVIFVIFVAYYMYRQGIRQLFKSRIDNNNATSDHLAYMFFMIAGLITGSFFTLYLLSLWLDYATIMVQIILSTVASIIIGEYMYIKNRNLIYKIITPQTKENETK
jgi:uncharacterized membrane protein YfcA